jgi:hypothetical protein
MCMYMCTYICMHGMVCMYVHTYIHISMNTYMQKYMRVHTNRHRTWLRHLDACGLRSGERPLRRCLSSQIPHASHTLPHHNTCSGVCMYVCMCIYIRTYGYMCLSVSAAISHLANVYTLVKMTLTNVFACHTDANASESILCAF